MRKLLLTFLFIPVLLAGQSVGSFTTIETKTASLTKTINPGLLIWVRSANEWYKSIDTLHKNITIQIAIDSSWLSHEMGSSLTSEIQVSNDSENNWTLPFTLRSTSVIIYNGTPLRSGQWSGTTTLNVSLLDTRKYDHLVIIN